MSICWLDGYYANIILVKLLVVKTLQKVVLFAHISVSFSFMFKFF